MAATLLLFPAGTIAAQNYSSFNLVLIHGLSDDASCWNQIGPALAKTVAQADTDYVEIGIEHSILDGATCLDGSVASLLDQEVDCNDLGSDYFGITDGINDGQPHFSALIGCDPQDCIFGLDKGQFTVSNLYWKFKTAASYTAVDAEKIQTFKGQRVFAVNFSNSEHLTFAAQGWELKAAIEDIASVTGISDFILIGHSMGGLAARAYIQNETVLNIKGLITIDTPHYGGQEWFGLAAGAYNFKGNAPLNLDPDSLALKNLNTGTGIASAYDHTMVYHLGYAQDLSYSATGDYYDASSGDGIVYAYSQMGLDALSPFRVIFSETPGSSNLYETQNGQMNILSETVQSADHSIILAEAHSEILEDAHLHNYLTALLPEIAANTLTNGSDTTGTVLLKTDLSFTLPDTDILGDSYTVTFRYRGEDAGSLCWTPSAITPNTTPATPDAVTIAPDLSFQIPDINYYGTPLWAGFQYHGEKSGIHLWSLVDAGTGGSAGP